MIRFRALGGLDLCGDDGVAIRSVLAQPRRLAVLASLALAGERGFLRRDTLVGRLWPESSQDRARHSLNQAVYRLRLSLGRDAIQSRGDEEVGLAPGRIWSDAGAFRSAIEERRDEEALTLYRGELLPGFFLPDAPEFERWLEEERGYLRTQAVGAARRLARRAREEGLASAAVSWARRAVELSPGDEEAMRELLRLMASAGDRAGAVLTYEAFVRRLAAEPGVEPSPETRDLVQEIRGPQPRIDAALPSTGGTGPTVDGTGATLPHPTSPLVGRDREVVRLLELLEGQDCRLLTITGPGGVGKTRLALELAHLATRNLEDRVWFVPLAGVPSPELLPAAIGQTLDLGATGGDAAERLSTHLGRRAGLLVLDNLDHLLDGASFLVKVVEGAPGLRILVTSREALRLRGEWIFPLEGLPVADEKGTTGVPAAAKLFIEAARRVTGGFEPEGGALESVARICRLLDGVPLALELAAAWIRVMPPEEIAREIETSLHFLSGRFRDGPERHRNLQATFERSWTLLTDEQQDALARLSVFRGGFHRQAAEEVAGADLESLACLVEKSLLRPSSHGRFEPLEVIRQFAGEKLAEDPKEEATVREKHALRYSRLLAGLRDRLSGPEADEALHEVAPEMDNLRTAWRTASDQRMLQTLATVADPLFALYDCRGWHGEGEVAFGDALQRIRADGASPVEAGLRRRVEGILLARRGACLLRLGRGSQAERLLREALEAVRGTPSVRETAFVLDRLGVGAYERGEAAEAERLQREALALRRSLADPREVAISLNNLGSLSFAVGNLPQARELCREALDLQQQLEDRVGEVISLHNLGQISLALGDGDEAEVRLQQALTAARRLGHGVLIIRSLLTLGAVEDARGRARDARRYFQPALARAMQIGAESLALEAILGTARSLCHEGEGPAALELVEAVLHQPALDSGVLGGAERLRQRLEAALPPGAVEEARTSGGQATLREVAASLVGSLPLDNEQRMKGP
jgi:predicted ATPase/DNA-binding SARP family transcriptional activator